MLEVENVSETRTGALGVWGLNRGSWRAKKKMRKGKNLEKKSGDATFVSAPCARGMAREVQKARASGLH